MEIDAASAHQEIRQESLDPMVNSVCHCACLSLKGPIDVETLRELLRRVRTTVPGLIELHFGENDMKAYPNKTDSANGKTHTIFSRHQNGHYLKVYHNHPARVQLMKYLQNFTDGPATVLDFVSVSSNL
ncbi:Stress responsive A/B Barrel Domain [Novymonas esmeraldas]|uniref:Stress responsive A/B Barrel Domain n=1 Tax=Novymonas esmeraldas TaxID=1808958 RepID=A0AAW0F6D9_9TRYP